jgi:hypothetical protein
MVVAIDVILLSLLVVILPVVVVVTRRRILQRRGVTFDCSLRAAPKSRGKGWSLGMARYAEDRLEWYRIFGFSVRPRHTYARRDLLVEGRRAPDAPEAMTLLAGTVIVTCRSLNETVELALSDEALTGLLAWIEASPPGWHTTVA